MATAQTDVTTVGVVGLGIMGSAISGHLLAAGFDVTGTDLARPAVDELVARGGRPAPDLGTLARESAIVITSLPSAEAAREVCRGIAAARPADLVVVETSTLSLAAKQECRELLATVGVPLLDCPLSGTGAQARDRDLVVLGSGDPAAFERTRPVLAAFARSVRHLGPFGHGTTTKLVANLLVSIHNAATAEAFALGVAAGLDPSVLFEAVRDGAGGSVIFDKRGPLMVDRAYRPATARVSMFVKDVSLVQELAASVGVATPVLDATLPLYAKAVEAGWADADAAALLEVVEAEGRA
ncbi:2-hydroxy-3-oxopropionate reductase [Plantactinospora mayteni]|uniref:2-hydroxy-3-oxopropionate reductase n=1 Tax=Plantactinospora mayteni TaxID=566021 RepID=A0ABQ4F1J4_9ACTN|nr:NAD(P)-dependent oxidoreductase [Plantactinospora mayteni]GIH00747.1 2-hydroxy-3-oxopropionate reductase [Plantactinospora mayteni]